VIRDDLPEEKRALSDPILLGKGSFSGEIALIMQVCRTCSVRAVTICELNVLSQAIFDRILGDNPRFARKINELVMQRRLKSSFSEVEGDKPLQSAVDAEIMKRHFCLSTDSRPCSIPEGCAHEATEKVKSPSDVEKNMTEPFDEIASRGSELVRGVATENAPPSSGGIEDGVGDKIGNYTGQRVDVEKILPRILYAKKFSSADLDKTQYCDRTGHFMNDGDGNRHRLGKMMEDHHRDQSFAMVRVNARLTKQEKMLEQILAHLDVHKGFEGSKLGAE